MRYRAVALGGGVVVSMSLATAGPAPADPPDAARSAAGGAAPVESAPAGATDEFGLFWHSDYAAAHAAARREKKLLLVSVETRAEGLSPDAETADCLRDFVLARLPLDGARRLLLNEAFRDFHNAPGVGIIDLKHQGGDYGRVVHVLPAIHMSLPGLRAMVALTDRSPTLPEPSWLTDYHAARAEAVRSRRMLLVAVDGEDSVFAPRPHSIPALWSYVLLRQTTETTYDVDGKPRRLLEFGDFAPLKGQPGVVIYDFKHVGKPYYGQVVSAMPYRYLGPTAGKNVFDDTYRERKLLTLEPGTLTQRTLTWAVRVSKGHGSNQPLRSADGRPNETLRLGARRNSQLQCRMGVGHFAGGLTGAEIASPGPGQDIVDAALNMVRIWSTSPPHYGVMVRYHAEHGYDMWPSSTNHWYGTGRF